MKRKLYYNISMRTWMTALLVAAAALGITACDDDDLATSSERTTSLAELEIPLSLPSAGVRTRANTTAETYVENIWVGIFKIDNSNGRISQCVHTQEIDWYQGGGEHGKAAAIKITLTKEKDQEDGPGLTAGNYYIASVANYTGVRGYKKPTSPEATVPELRTLRSLLNEVSSWDDFLNIAVETESAQRQEYPLMEGNFISSNGGANNDHGVNALYMVNYDGTPHLFDTGKTVSDYCMTVTSSSGKASYSAGTLHLRRLLSQVTVNVKIADQLNASNVRLKVCNQPQAVYLQERVNIPANPGMIVVSENNISTDGETAFAEILKDEEQYKTYTPNFADLGYEGIGYTDAEFISAGEGTSGSYTGTGSSFNGKQYTITYNRYDNKHWGLPIGEGDDNKKYDDREARDEDGRFLALCPEGCLYNNLAPYFVIAADFEIESKDQKAGDDGQKKLLVAAQYTVHEGLSSNLSDGQSSTSNGQSSPEYRDFGCWRNCNYTYNVTIKSLNSILVDVLKTDDADYPKDKDASHRNGATGEVTKIVKYSFDAEGNFEESQSSTTVGKATIFLTDAERKNISQNWRFIVPYYVTTSPENSDIYSNVVDFGYSHVSLPLGSLETEDGTYEADVNARNEEENLRENQFYNWVIFYDAEGTEIGGIEALANWTPKTTENHEETEPRKFTVGAKAYTYKYAFDDTQASLTDKNTPITPRFIDTDIRALYFSIPKENSLGQTYYISQSAQDLRENLPAPYVTFAENGNTSLEVYEHSSSPVVIEWTAPSVNYPVYYAVSLNNGTPTIQNKTTYGVDVSQLNVGETYDLFVQTHPQNKRMAHPSSFSNIITLIGIKKPEPKVWDFTTSEWKTWAQTKGISGTKNVSGPYDYEKDGITLHVATSSQSARYDSNNNCFYLNNSGVNCSFKFTAASAGVVIVKAYWDGSRSINITNNNTALGAQLATSKDTELKWNINAGEVYVHSAGSGTYIYSIQYEPSY